MSVGRPSAKTFIVGDHRSGTTLLYQMLAATGSFTVVTAYHVIRGAELAHDVASGRVLEMRAALDELLRRRGLVDRGIDGVKVSADLPEEYGFAVEDRARPRLRRRSLPRFLELCRLVEAGHDGLPLLLKNPWDALQFMTLKRLVPEARFVFLHREPVAVVSSQLRAIRSLMSARNEYVALLAPWYASLFESPLRLALGRLLFSARAGLGVRIVERHVARVCDYFVRQARRLEKHDAVSLRYEELCAEPAGSIARVLAFAGIEERAASRLEPLVEQRAPAILPEVARREARFRRRVRRYCAVVGYAA